MRTAELVISLLANAGIRRIYGGRGCSCLDLVESARAQDVALVAPRQLTRPRINGRHGRRSARSAGVCLAPGGASASMPPWRCLAGRLAALVPVRPGAALPARAIDDQFENDAPDGDKGWGPKRHLHGPSPWSSGMEKGQYTPKRPVYLWYPSDRSQQPARSRGRSFSAPPPKSPSRAGFENSRTC